MGTFILKKFSSNKQPKTYRLTRKTFGVVGAVGDGLKTAAGETFNAAGTVAKSGVAKTAGTIGGMIKGAAMGGLPGAIIGGIVGNKSPKIVGNALQATGDTLQT